MNSESAYYMLWFTATQNYYWNKPKSLLNIRFWKLWTQYISLLKKKFGLFLISLIAKRKDLSSKSLNRNVLIWSEKSFYFILSENMN
ncbi:unnamed protein product [Blepharisma stoltei]|uniref:Uncharacterized protein n=1 Tax=Blepharisma stoltei TaxID=1481888 RepID=A0AAU9J2S4_9CILI|nr:unnamed protein product [Blepharisma stoltei]